MIPFATEFPVKPSENKAKFVAEVIAWLRGMKSSQVLTTSAAQDLDVENPHLKASNGEELRIRLLGDPSNWSAVGFRHDMPDEQGRLWRTEAVLRRSQGEGQQDLVRLRTQCLAIETGARLDRPRKPFLIKALLNNGWGGRDGQLTVADKPNWLPDSADGLESACSVTLGNATNWLPSIYISATDKGDWLLSQHEIDKLAYDLGGVAHVLVEPNRAYSFSLRDRTDGKNAYGGTIGLSVPGRGIVRRFYLGWQTPESNELVEAIKSAATMLRGQMPAVGWDWTELQEQSLRAQRERDRNGLTSAESEKLYQDEIANLQDKIRQLEQQLGARDTGSIGSEEYEFTIDNLVRRIGPEIYSGEISDRIRLAAKGALSVADQSGIDRRSREIWQRFIDRIPVSPALLELLQDLRRATKDGNRLAAELTALLKRHGYIEKAGNKHIRLEAKIGYEGLDAITIAKTPSDHRGLENQRKQVERILGLTRLHE